MAKKRLFTGLQPSGTLHIGNYFGVLKPFVDMYEKYDSFLMVADYHALTSLREPAVLRENIKNVVRDYVAVGVNPLETTIFQQSQVQEHTELAWILECLITVPTLMISHAFKAKVAQAHVKWAKDKGVDILSDEYFKAAEKEDPRFDAQVSRLYSGINAGLFNYPMLMASDILLYDTDVVPVGEDQRQHLEYARDTAAKFNNAYGETLKEPKELIQRDIAVVPGTDGNKMSKSYGNTIPLFGSKDEIARAVMSIVTDSSGESPKNVYNIHRLFRSKEELAPIYSANKGNYKASKEGLIEDIEKTVAPMRERRASVSDADVVCILKEGSDKARAIASAKMRDVRKKIGVALN